MAIGLASMTVPMYIAEVAPTKYRYIDLLDFISIKEKIFIYLCMFFFFFSGALVSANVLFITGGQFISYLAAAGLSLVDNGSFLFLFIYLFMNLSSLIYLSKFVCLGWRYMLGIAAIPPVLQVIGMFFLPESPRYLVKQGKLEEAKK